MVYRFVLEVPEQLADDAGVAVAMAGDAQVLVERNSHGLGFDDPYVDLSIAAHSLGVIGTLAAWARDIGVQRPESRSSIRIVLHGGRRVALEEADAPAVIAAIRRDQPWIERSVPKIGEHEDDPVTDTLLDRGEDPLVPEANRSLATATAAPPATILAVELIQTDDELTVEGTEHPVIPVMSLEPAERFYRTALSLRVERRLRREGDDWDDLGGGPFDHRRAENENREPDLVFLRNGPLSVVLQHAGRAARLDYGRAAGEIALAVDPPTAARIKATVLMRGVTLLTAKGSAFAFRDPFGVVWDIHSRS